MNGGQFVDTITHWTVWLWPSIMVSVSWNDEVVHKTYCFDLDLSLMLVKVTNNLDYFPFFRMDAGLNAGEFDSVGVTLFQFSSSILTDGYHFACSTQQTLCLFNNYHACIAMPTWCRCAPPILFLPGLLFRLNLVQRSCLSWICMTNLLMGTTVCAVPSKN